MSSSSIVNSAPIDFREAVFRSALDDMAEGRPVDVGELLHARRAGAVEDMARQLDPVAFAERDRLLGHRDSYRRWIGELGDQRAGDSRLVAIDDEIAALRAKVEGAPNRRKAKIYQERIDALTAERQTRAAALTAGDSPDMARVRKALQETDFKLRDLAPRVSAALKEADSRIPGAVEVQAPELRQPIDPLDRQYDPLIEKAPDRSDPLDDVVRESVRNTLRRKAAPHVDQEAKGVIAAVNERTKLEAGKPASTQVLDSDLAEAEQAMNDALAQIEILRKLHPASPARTATEKESSLVGREIIQRDGGKVFVVDRINGDKVILKEKGGPMSVTLRVSDLTAKLDTPGAAWRRTESSAEFKEASGLSPEDEAVMVAADEAVKREDQVGKLRGMAARCIIGSGG